MIKGRSALDVMLAKQAAPTKQAEPVPAKQAGANETGKDRYEQAIDNTVALWHAYQGGNSKVIRSVRKRGEA